MKFGSSGDKNRDGHEMQVVAENKEKDGGDQKGKVLPLRFIVWVLLFKTWFHKHFFFGYL